MCRSFLRLPNFLGDKTQFFRADAAFERVREELEFKHGCFHNAVRFFTKKSQHWSKVALDADKAQQPGPAAYARKKAAVYDALRADCSQKFNACGIQEFVHIPEGKTLADQVAAYRSREDSLFPKPR